MAPAHLLSSFRLYIVLLTHRVLSSTAIHPFSKFAMGADAPVSSVHVHGVRAEAKVPWSTGLCDCFSDVPGCCLTFWCPCVAFGRIAEIVDRGSSSCCLNGTLYTLVAFTTGLACLCSCFYRSKMRNQYGLKGNNCTDCLSHTFCEICALCQVYRELKNRGFEMKLGWDGNVEKHPSATAAPRVEGGMNR